MENIMEAIMSIKQFGLEEKDLSKINKYTEYIELIERESLKGKKKAFEGSYQYYTGNLSKNILIREVLEMPLNIDFEEN